MSHSDMVIHDAAGENVLTVEYDGPSGGGRHSTDRDTLWRDLRKNWLFANEGMPLLRIDGGLLDVDETVREPRTIEWLVRAILAILRDHAEGLHRPPGLFSEESADPFGAATGHPRVSKPEGGDDRCLYSYYGKPRTELPRRFPHPEVSEHLWRLAQKHEGVEFAGRVCAPGLLPPGQDEVQSGRWPRQEQVWDDDPFEVFSTGWDFRPSACRLVSDERGWVRLEYGPTQVWCFWPYSPSEPELVTTLPGGRSPIALMLPVHPGHVPALWPTPRRQLPAWDSPAGIREEETYQIENLRVVPNGLVAVDLREMVRELVLLDVLRRFVRHSTDTSAASPP